MKIKLSYPSTAKLKPIFILGLSFLLNSLSFATRYYWVGGNNGNFNDLSNWIEYDNFTNPSSFTSSDEFQYSTNSTITLNSSIQIQKLIISNGTLALGNNTLTVLSLELISPATITKGTSGKIAYSNANDGELFIEAFSSFNLTEFYFPMASGTTRPRYLTIRKCTLNLVQNIAVKDIFMFSNASNPSYLKFNGYTLTMNRFRSATPPHYGFIGDDSAVLIFENLTNDATNVRFTSNSGENRIKALRKTGNSSTSVFIITDLQITDEIQSNKGKIETTANLTLLSSSTKTCKVITGSGGYITASGTGKVVTQQYIPGSRRVFRFISNPYSSALALSQLTDDIDITGAGGSANGFTSTSTNNPSCYYFDAANADNNTSGQNSGWTAFTSASASNWASSQPIFLYIRGAKSEGLDGTAYTPSSVTLTIEGQTLNYDTKTINLTKGANSDFIAIGNPYFSPIEIGNLASAQRTNIGNSFYVFDANLGTNGGYITKSWGSSYILPALGGFFTTLSASGSITFNETDKSTSSGDDIFTRTPSPNRLNIEIFKGDRMYDATDLVLDSGLTQKFDAYDAEKMSNFDLNLFTVSTEGKHLAINQALFEAGNIIPLGIETAESGDFTFQIPNNSFPENYKLTLIDALKKTSTDLTGGSSYSFQIDSKNTASFQNRFAIQVDATQKTQNLNDAKCVIYPNPAANNESIEIMANQPIYKVELFDLNGKLVTTLNGQKQQHLQLTSQELKEGIFIAKIHFLNQISTQKIIIK